MTRSTKFRADLRSEGVPMMTPVLPRRCLIRVYRIQRHNRHSIRRIPGKRVKRWVASCALVQRTVPSVRYPRRPSSKRNEFRPRAVSFDPDDYFETEAERILRPSNREVSPLQAPNLTSRPLLGSGVDFTSDGTSTSKPDDREADQISEESRFFNFLDDGDGSVPKTWYHRALWLWERPVMKLGRLTVFFAQLPALFTFLASQVAVLMGQITLPMLPPLLLGAGILLRTIWVNAGHLFPRVSLTMLLLYGIWFLNSLAYRTIAHLTNQGTLSRPAAHTIMNWTEGLTLVTAGLVMLSLFGVNISGLLLPAGVCLALAANDLAHNFLAGIVLFLAQPFQVGDEVVVQPQSGQKTEPSQRWYEGVCERVDLRYTVLRRGRYKLHVPNASFITREFMVLDPSYDPDRVDDASVDQISDKPLPKNREEAHMNGSPVDEDDLPSEVDYPQDDLYTSDLTEAAPEA